MKEIKEKTFELNITSELLNLTKSFLWYKIDPKWFHFLEMPNWKDISDFLRNNIVFAEGLTQEEESNPNTGGYDVSINYKTPQGQDGRILFLQYKAGVRKGYSNNPNSQFFRSTAKKEKRDPQHILFKFNDAANGTQHSTLRTLAHKKGLKSKSVLYVFPRITEKADFMNKTGRLISNSSWVPVLDLDAQAAKQKPAILIKDKKAHKYRTSYNGLTSEVNFFFFWYDYDSTSIAQILAELICIQIERFMKILKKQQYPLMREYVHDLIEILDQFVEYELEGIPSKFLVIESVKKYLLSLLEGLKWNYEIPVAPSEFTTIVPQEGLKLQLEEGTDYSSLSYQLF